MTSPLIPLLSKEREILKSFSFARRRVGMR